MFTLHRSFEIVTLIYIMTFYGTYHCAICVQNLFKYIIYHTQIANLMLSVLKFYSLNMGRIINLAHSSSLNLINTAV